MSEDSYVVAWDKNGPIEVEMIVGVGNTKRSRLTGDMTIKDAEIVGEEPVKQFAGRQWVT